MLLIFGTLYIIGVIALVSVARRENIKARKTAKHVHDQYITDTLLDGINIPKEDMGFIAGEHPFFESYKTLN